MQDKLKTESDRFQGCIFEIKHNHNTTVARHFGGHKDHVDPNITTYTWIYKNTKGLTKVKLT